MTSGPTVEPLDPVRFISNHSTGKMGTALAKRLAQHGAKVIFVSGPVRKYPHHPSIEVIKVKTAAEMYQAATQHFPHCQGAILTAAVADYTPAVVAHEKIKKNSDQFHLELKKNPDIAASLGQAKQASQFLVGFALETNNELENAKKKIASKNLDFVVLNSLQDKGAGFGHDTNQITIVQRNGQVLRYDLKSKEAVAEDICQALIQHCSGAGS
jgi:phosphopantothenoylcysteine decarboxylase/phosphopantothenate--cysteine ligase